MRAAQQSIQRIRLGSASTGVIRCRAESAIQSAPGCGLPRWASIAFVVHCSIMAIVQIDSAIDTHAAEHNVRRTKLKWINQYCFIQKWLVVRDARYGTRAIPYLQGLATKAISAINVVARHLVYPQAVLLAQSHNIGNGC